MTQQQPKKKQRCFKDYGPNSIDWYEADDFNQSPEASLMERAAYSIGSLRCFKSCIFSGNLRHAIGYNNRKIQLCSVSPAVQASILQTRQVLPWDLQCLAQYWLAKLYQTNYSEFYYTADCDYDHADDDEYGGGDEVDTAKSCLVDLDKRGNESWLLHDQNLQMPPCMVEGFRWLEWAHYKDSMQGTRKASRWVYLSPVSSNMLIHGILDKPTIMYGLDRSCKHQVFIMVRRGPSQPWALQAIFQYYTDKENLITLELMRLGVEYDSVWPFSFAAPPRYDAYSKYKVEATRLDESAPASSLGWYYAAIGSKYAPKGRTDLTPERASKIGIEIMLWFRWVLGLDPSEAVSNLSYPWIDKVLFPNFQKSDDQDAIKARWTHGVAMLGQPWSCKDETCGSASKSCPQKEHSGGPSDPCATKNPKLPPFRAEL